MALVQIRRYDIVPDQMDHFLEWWRDLVLVREQYGFTVVFGLADRVTGEFTWAVSFDGDADQFQAAEDEYHASPERAAALARVRTGPDGLAGEIRSIHVGMVEVVLAPRGSSLAT